MRAVAALAGLVACAGGAGTLAGQGLSLGAGRVVATPAADSWSAGWFLPRIGPLGVALGGVWYDGQDGDRWGPQVEFDLFRARPQRWYAIGSLGAGFGSTGAASPWAAWGLGAGYRVFGFAGIDLGVEGRYLHLSTPQNALVVGLRLTSSSRGAGRPRSVPPPDALPLPPTVLPAPLATAAPVPADARSIIQTAVDVMGAPYTWGGTAANGFDCSGLIQYAFGRHGIILPRRSVEQARAGRLVPRDIQDLLPGDILTFAARPGGPVSHVGLYIGDRRFIHSASDGVRLSLLGPDDPSGRHWFERWVGARRILE